MPYEIRESRLLFEYHALSGYVAMLALTHTYLKSVPWTFAEFYFNRGLQRSYTSTCIILQKNN